MEVNTSKTPWWDNAKVLSGSNDRIWRTTVDDMIRQPADLVIIVMVRTESF